jgi:hypothetical protein
MMQLKQLYNHNEALKNKNKNSKHKNTHNNKSKIKQKKRPEQFVRSVNSKISKITSYNQE